MSTGTGRAAGRTTRRVPRGRRRTTRAAAPVLALGLTVALGLSGLAASSQPFAGLDLPDDPLRGRALFESKQCLRCHGIGDSGPSIGPTLGEGRFNGTFLELGAALWSHVPGMSVSFAVTGLAWPELSSKETIELVAFLYFIDYLGRPGVAAAGSKVFEAQGCSSCHTIGTGAAKVGPDLAGLRGFASPLAVAQEIWNHGPSMFESMRRMDMPPPRFDEGDLADLSAFIRQEAGPGPRQPLLFAPGNPNRGRELFVAKGCSSCHGRDARGGRGGPDLGEFDLRQSAEAIAGTMWNHALAMSDAMRERGVAWPEFKEAELADLVAFLYFLPFADPPGDPGRGADVFAARCSACHNADTAAQALPRGPELAGSDAVGSPAALVAAMWNHAPLMKEAILGEGRPWPELTGSELRDLQAHLARLSQRVP